MYIYIYLYSSRLLGTFSDTWIIIVERNQKVTYVHFKNKVISVVSSKRTVKGFSYYVCAEVYHYIDHKPVARHFNFGYCE